MARIKDFKENGPDWLNMSLLDFITNMDNTKTKKYVPMMINVFGKMMTKNYGKNEIKEIREELLIGRKIVKPEQINNLSDTAVVLYWRFLDLFSHADVRMVVDFMEQCERYNPKGLDTTHITDIEELNSYLSLLSLKDEKKEFEKQIVREFENDTWLVIRPLTWESSCKYGASTKWCTAASSEAEHFYRYGKKGSLLYIINKNTGYKVAWFYDKDVRDKGEVISSFWNSADNRVDFTDTQLDLDIFMWIKSKIDNNQIITNLESNSEVFNEGFNRIVKIEKQPYEGEIMEEQLMVNEALPYPEPEISLENILERVRGLRITDEVVIPDATWNNEDLPEEMEYTPYEEQ